LIQPATDDLTLTIDDHAEGIDDGEHRNFDRTDLAEGAALPAPLSRIGPVRPLADVSAAACSLVPQREAPWLRRSHRFLAERFVRIDPLAAEAVRLLDHGDVVNDGSRDGDQIAVPAWAKSSADTPAAASNP
jgi:hypothetical protein